MCVGVKINLKVFDTISYKVIALYNNYYYNVCDTNVLLTDATTWHRGTSMESEERGVIGSLKQGSGGTAPRSCMCVSI